MWRVCRNCSSLRQGIGAWTRAVSVEAAQTFEDVEELRTAVQDFARENVAPYADRVDRENSFPKEVNLWTRMGDFGLHGVTVAPKYGGLGLGYLHHCIVMEELSRASGSIALAYIAHSLLCVSHLDRFGNDQQKAKYLPTLVTGEKIGALSMSEVGSGSDVVSMRTRADPVDGGYLLNGSKMWCTNGPVADVVVVYAKTSPDKGSHGISCFIVEKGMEGFSAAQKLDKLGMRGSDTSELVFKDCWVPLENVLGEVDKGVYVLMKGLDYERLVLAAGPVGLMRAMLDVVLPYTHERTQFGQKIGEFQLVQAKLADMYTVTRAAQAYVYDTARQTDAKGPDRKDCAAVILYAAERATRMALDAIQILGGNGYMNEFPTGRFLRDSKMYEIGAGTSEIRRLLIGRELYRQSG